MLDAGPPAAHTPRVATLPADAAPAVDLGGCSVRPSAIARPAAPEEVPEALQWARERDMPVRARGTCHTMGGQGLVDGGLHLDMRGMDQILDVRDDEIDVQAGVVLRDIVATAAEHGRRLVSGTTSYTRLTIGGVASVGGVSKLPAAGAVIDHVRRMQVARPEGLVWCSPTQRPDLFRRVLGGLGRHGVITRLVLELTTRPEVVRTWTLSYPHTRLDAALQQLGRLARSGVDEAMLMLAGTDPTTVHIMASNYSTTGADEVLDPRVTGTVPRIQQTETDYLDHTFQLDPLYDQPGWDDSTKIWTDVWLPDSQVVPYANATLPRLADTTEMSSTSYALAFPHRRNAIGRQGRLQLPAAAGGDDELVTLVDILRDDYHQPDPAWRDTALTHHHADTARAHDLGGTVYPVGTPA